MWTVYKIKNITNGRTYFGSTSNPKARAKQHFKMLRGCYHYSIGLQIDFIKGHLFTFEEIDTAESSDMAENIEYRNIKADSYNIKCNSKAQKASTDELNALLNIRGTRRKTALRTNYLCDVKETQVQILN